MPEMKVFNDINAFAGYVRGLPRLDRHGLNGVTVEGVTFHGSPDEGPFILDDQKVEWIHFRGCVLTELAIMSEKRMPSVRFESVNASRVHLVGGFDEVALEKYAEFDSFALVTRPHANGLTLDGKASILRVAGTVGQLTLRGIVVCLLDLEAAKVHKAGVPSTSSVCHYAFGVPLTVRQCIIASDRRLAECLRRLCPTTPLVGPYLEP